MKRGAFIILIITASLAYAAAAVLWFLPLGAVYVFLVIPRLSEKAAFAGMFPLFAAAYIFTYPVYRTVLRRILNKKKPQALKRRGTG
jgi:membrane protein implicated in regulation of membrane protease activity